MSRPKYHLCSLILLHLVISSHAERKLCDQVKIQNLAEKVCSMNKINDLEFNGLSKALVKVWANLGWNSVTITTTNKDKNTAISKEASQYSIFTSFLFCHHKTLATKMEINGYFTLLLDQNLSLLMHLLSYATLPPDSILVVLPKEKPMPNFKEELRDLQETKSFFIFSMDEEELFHVLAGKNGRQVTLNSLGKMESLLKPWHKETDMNGFTIDMITIDWEPFSRVIACSGSDGHSNCEVTGLMADIVEEVVHMFNFTKHVKRQPDLHWGTVPHTGDWANCNATFTGLFGTLVSGQNDIGMTTWFETIERLDYISFSASTALFPFIIGINTLDPPVDFYMYFRPFTDLAWLGICICVIIFFGYIIIVGNSDSKWNSGSTKCAEFVLWAAFVVLSSGYYSGALTMFFTVSPALPFRDEIQALKMYPTWKMVVQEGSDILIQPMAQAGIKEYQDYWSLLQSDEQVKKDLMVPYDKLMEKLLTPGYFIFGGSSTLYTAYDEHGKNLPNFQFHAIKCPRNQMSSSLALAKNSPLITPINIGLMELKESGTGDLISKKWLIPPPKANTFSISTASPVKFGQVGLPLLLMGVSVAVSIIVLLMEVIARSNK